jgi:hypothetical protein
LLNSPAVGEPRRGEAVNSEPFPESEPHPEDRALSSTAEDRAPGSGGEDTQVPPSGRKDLSESPVAITLSPNQVDHIVREVLGEGAAPSVSALVAGTGFHRSHARQVLSSRYRSLQDNRRLSRSLLAGLLVLSCFPPEGVDMGIKDISEQLDLNTSTVHRYVLTLVAAGLLERDPDTRRYRLLPE